jgi:hypothetical protein
VLASIKLVTLEIGPSEAVRLLETGVGDPHGRVGYEGGSRTVPQCHFVWSSCLIPFHMVLFQMLQFDGLGGG